MERNRTLLALMDEYRRAAVDYKQLLANMSQADYSVVRDTKTTDPDCRSVQTVTEHLVFSGYTYAGYINKANGQDPLIFRSDITDPQQAIEEIDRMLDHTEAAFNGMWHQTDEQLMQYSFATTWQVTYDLEQLMEHAIVHILRHRRQVEGFLDMEM